MIIDFRSDTVTRPSPAMQDAMMNAETGDDVFGEDPSINELEKMASEMFGMQAAVFCPSGTMTNQIAVKCHTQPGDEVICDTTAHIYQYEGGGVAFNSGASVNYWMVTGEGSMQNKCLLPSIPMTLTVLIPASFAWKIRPSAEAAVVMILKK